MDTSNPRDSIEIRKRIAYLPGELGLYSHMTSRQNLKFLLSLYDVQVEWSIVEQLADRLELNLKQMKATSKK